MKALELGLHTWATISPAVFEELEATPAGAEALSMHFPDWRERLVARTRATPEASRVAVRIPATGVSRSRAFEVLTGGPVAPESLAKTLELTDNFHQYTDSLDLLDADSRGALLLAVRAKQGTIEIEVTQEMLSNEREFLERFQKALSTTAPSDSPSQPKPVAVAPAPAPGAAPARSTAKPPPLP